MRMRTTTQPRHDMRGTVAKKLRRYVNVKYGFLADEDLYRTLPNGELQLADQCKKKMYKVMKQGFKRRKISNV
jgi:hypothetical protein